MSQLSTNTTSLQAILDAVNALPEAGEGSGGGTVETCTVITKSGSACGASVTCYENGEFVARCATDTTNTSFNHTFENVVCGSCVVVTNANSIIGIQTEKAEVLENNDADSEDTGFRINIAASGVYRTLCFKVTATSGGTATIYLYDND